VKALVTGGGGFLGSAIVRRLKERGDEVRSFSRSDYPELADLGVEQVRGDLADSDAVARAVEGVDCVLHVGAKPGAWGAYEGYFQANVVGTRNVVAACREHGVRKLVHCSSPSVVFDGLDQEGVDESVPYSRDHHAPYSATKAIAEEEVLAEADDSLGVVALRPHLVWGPGDNHLLPRLATRARAGRLRLVGDGMKLIDTVWVGNAADAHLLAADRIEPGSAISGRAYFISNGEPRTTGEMINALLAAAGVPPVTKTVSPRMAMIVAAILETAWRVFRLDGEPPLTRFVAAELATAHWYDISAARRDLGYEPRVSIDEGLERLAASFREGRQA
jgi:nucleoside-diphosphate-sugar epimerase